MKMAEAKSGDAVKVHYTGTLDDGTVFDSSADRPPLELTLGEEQVIPGFEEALVGMAPGDSKTVTIPADQAYGAHDADLVMTFEREDFPEDLDPQVGQVLRMEQPGGQGIRVAVVEVSDTNVTLDANHPLAGKDLTFDVQLVEIS